MTRPIFLLTDFGLTDTYVGIVKAVMLSIAPGASLVDLNHAIPPQDVRAGAFALLAAAPFLPSDAVVLAVVDPGVGSERRAVAVQAGTRTFVGPDNGLLSWALAQTSGDGAAGGDVTGVRAVVLDQPAFWLPNVSATFHGRDIFGPVAAHIANGVPLLKIGTPADHLEQLPFPEVSREMDTSGHVRMVRGEVVHIDHYGNLITNVTAADLPPNPLVSVGEHALRGLAAHYQADSSPLLALIGSTGFLEVSAPNGSAAAATGARVRTPLTVQPDDQRGTHDD